ncbi:hypothetical protein RB298_04995 [Priestia sp. BR_2]
MFNKRNDIHRKMIELKKENLALKVENESLKKDSSPYETKTLLNLFHNFSDIDIEFLPFMLKRDGVKKIEIQAVMELLKVKMGVRYAVRIIGFTQDNETKEYASITVQETGDGCIYNPFACQRRSNIFDLTQNIANYTRAEVERVCQRRRLTLEISQIDIKLDDLLYYDPAVNRVI